MKIASLDMALYERDINMESCRFILRNEPMSNAVFIQNVYERVCRTPAARTLPTEPIFRILGIHADTMTYYGLQSIVEVLHDLAQESWGHAWAQRRGIASHNPKDMVESMLPYLGNVNENDGTHPLTTIAKEVLRHLPDLSHDDIHPRLQVLDPGLYDCIRQRLMEALDGPVDLGPG